MLPKDIYNYIKLLETSETNLGWYTKCCKRCLSWCSGHNICLTHRRLAVRARPRSNPPKVLGLMVPCCTNCCKRSRCAVVIAFAETFEVGRLISWAWSLQIYFQCIRTASLLLYHICRMGRCFVNVVPMNRALSSLAEQFSPSCFFSDVGSETLASLLRAD
uniref:Uncharacterized protein n=1 Tax=Parascaris univalens TaxID=6257 RepID=A0A914ZSP8_PARUN